MKEKHQIHNTKMVRITNALSETMRISFNETVLFDNCYIFKSHAVEPRLSMNLHYSVLELYLQHPPLKRQGEESTSSLDRKERIGGVGKGLVKMSAMLSFLETNPTLRSWRRTFSLT